MSPVPFHHESPTGRQHRLARYRLLIEEAQVLAHDEVEWLFTHLASAPNTPSGVPTSLDKLIQAFQEKLTIMAKALDQVAADWPTLKQAITDRLAADTQQLQTLTDELKGLDADDPRADEIHQEMMDVLAQVKGVVTATPAPATDSSTSAAGAGASTQAAPSGSASGTAGTTAGKVSG